MSILISHEKAFFRKYVQGKIFQCNKNILYQEKHLIDGINIFRFGFNVGKSECIYKAMISVYWIVIVIVVVVVVWV